MSERITYEKISNKHLRDIAIIHLVSLNEGILVKFGLKFLIEMYRAIILNDSNFGYVALKRGQVIGFAMGVVVPISLVSCIKFNAIINFLKNSFLSPRLILSLFSLLRQKTEYNETGIEVEISQIAVLNAHRGNGIGGNLVKLIENEAVRLGINNITTRTHNKNFVLFYINQKRALVTNEVLIANNLYSSLKWQVDPLKSPYKN